MTKLFTGIPNIDRNILSYVGDDVITVATSLNRYIYRICDNDFWKSRFYKKYTLLLETYEELYRCAYTTLLTLNNKQSIKYCAYNGFISLLSTFPKYNSSATLNYAIKCNQLSVVQHLIGAGVESTDESIDYAIKYASLPIFEELLYNDVNVSVDTFLNAIRYCKVDIVDFFISGGLDSNTRNYALVESLMVPNIPVDIIKSILRTGVDLSYNIGDLAIRTKNAHIVKVCLQFGLNINDNNGSYLKTAVTSSNVEIVKTLILYGITVNKKLNILKEAVLNQNNLENNNIEIVKLLCELNIVSKRQLCMSLLFAAENGISCIARILLNNGADVNSKRGNVLLLAIQGYYQNPTKRKEYIATITLLLKRGADVNAQEGSPILLAAKMELRDIVELLVAYGADTRVLNPSSCVKYDLRITGGGTIYCLAVTSKFIRCTSLKAGDNEYCDKHTGGYIRNYNYYQ